MKLIVKLTGVRRMVDSGDPKVLLLPFGWQRNHCWVSEYELDCDLPQAHHKPVYAIVDAEEQTYIRKGVEFSTTLKINSIKRIRKNKAKKILKEHYGITI